MFVAALLQFGCLPDELLEAGRQSFTAKINGEDFKADRLGSAAYVNEGDNGEYQVNITGRDIENIAAGTSRIIVMSFSGNNFSNLRDGQSFQAYDLNTEKGVQCYYFDTTDPDNPIMFGSILNSLANINIYENISSSLRITSINRNEETISGDFSFELYYPDEDATYTITDGKFRNLPYTIEEEDDDL
jgi:hypothetical protein